MHIKSNISWTKLLNRFHLLIGFNYWKASSFKTKTSTPKRMILKHNNTFRLEISLTHKRSWQYLRSKLRSYNHRKSRLLQDGAFQIRLRVISARIMSITKRWRKKGNEKRLKDDSEERDVRGFDELASISFSFTSKGKCILIFQLWPNTRVHCDAWNYTQCPQMPARLFCRIIQKA